ncbi:hypothetical protein CWI38_1410p0020 [Hamiltosporidium tvaerminnensis]|uniref:Uncharacterized protein n=1 Tax=Hamiltosporidium tvaerminnensis TaxID=1176355 RepID=A0A4Q9LSF9_9MICR|nr:hypothetical protein CWI38_1410p0020 [Hamiltosporidium tvaerminnensis]
MSRRKKVDSENIRNKKIKAVNNLENSVGELLMCDVDVDNSPVSLVDTIKSSSGTNATACEPANGMSNPNTEAILEGNRLIVLHSILDSVTVVEQEWPRSAILAVQKRFERMPRNGWPAKLRYYNEKFSCTLDIDAIATCVTEPCTLTNTTEFINLIDKFLSKIKEISEKKIAKVVIRTQKLPGELVDSKVSDLINRIICEYAGAHVTEYAISRLSKEKPKSAWKENIESKISKLVLSKDLLEKARKQEKLSTSETKSLKKIIREFNLNLSSVTDLSEALQFRKENRMFELFRGRFYRGLSERVESEHVVSRDEIGSFWSTLWNKNDDTVTYDDYLIPFVSDNHPTTFPSLDGFVNILN